MLCPSLHPPEDYWYSFLLEGVNLRAIEQMKGSGKFKKSNYLIRIEPVTFQLVAWYLNQLCYCVP
jgi:hypothetical protein